MPDDPYRSAYRVEETTRAPTAEELARVHARRDERTAHIRKQAMSGPRDIVVPLVVAVIAIGVGFAIDNPAVIFAGGLMTVMLTVIFVIARRKALERLAGYAPGPWSLADDEYEVREIRVVARSVVGAASGDEDYATWALFEIPGSRWLYVDPLCVPLDGAGASVDALARADVRLTQLLPHGEFLSAALSGDAIPRRGASGGSDDYTDALERGFEWRPGGPIDDERDEEAEQEHDESLEPGPIGRIAEDELPRWIRDLVGD